MATVKYRKLNKYKYETLKDVSVKIRIFPDEDIVTSYCTLTTKGKLTIFKRYAWDEQADQRLMIRPT